MKERTLRTNLESQADLWVKQKGCRSNTARCYMNEVRTFLDWVERQQSIKTLKGISELHLEDFLTSVLAKRASTKKPSAANLRSLDQTRRIVSNFLVWLAKQGEIPMRSSLVTDREFIRRMTKGVINLSARPCTTGELSVASEFLHEPGHKTDFIDARTALLGAFSFWCSCTAAQLAALTLSDVKITSQGVAVTLTRDNRQTISLPLAWRAPINLYLKQRKSHAREAAYFFISDQGGRPLKEWAIRKAIHSLSPNESVTFSAQFFRRIFLHLCVPLDLPAGQLAYRRGVKSMSAEQTGDLSQASLRRIQFEIARVGGAS